MSQLQNITSQTFDAEVLRSNQPVLLEFGAAWCQPCRILEPVLEELAAEWGPRVKVAKLDVDEAADITGSFQVVSVPTTMLFLNGKVVERLVGFQSKERISSKVLAHLPVA